jgi:hypothetical protein
MGGLSITACIQTEQEKPVTELYGRMRDQPELFGVLNTLYDLHLTLLSVKQVKEDAG